MYPPILQDPSHQVNKNNLTIIFESLWRLYTKITLDLIQQANSTLLNNQAFMYRNYPDFCLHVSKSSDEFIVCGLSLVKEPKYIFKCNNIILQCSTFEPFPTYRLCLTHLQQESFEIIVTKAEIWATSLFATMFSSLFDD